MSFYASSFRYQLTNRRLKILGCESSVRVRPPPPAITYTDIAVFDGWAAWASWMNADEVINGVRQELTKYRSRGTPDPASARTVR
jgi:hypothetical protein